MPGFITHYLCAQAILNLVSPELQNVLTKFKNIYNIGAQGPDIFFYYLPGLIKKRTKNVGTIIHKENAGEFILTMADMIKNKTSKEQAVNLAYTAGFITHYAMDASAHPYVYARTTFENKTMMQNRVEHRKLETAIDVLLLKYLSGTKPAQYKLWHLINADAWQMYSAADVVSAALVSVYDKKIKPQEVYKAMRYMIQLTRILQSNKNRRKRCMELVEDLTLGTSMISSIIHMQQVNTDDDFLNMKKKTWNQQKNKNDSFIELYQHAVKDGTIMAESLYFYMQGEISKNQLIRQIGNRSLKTGEPWVSKNA